MSVRGRARRAGARQLAREHVEQHFRIGAGVEVAQVLADQYLGELGSVRQVAVVTEADAVRRIDHERLRFRRTVAACSGIADVADADVALEAQHVALLEDVAHQAVLLAHEQLAFVAGHDAGGVLAAVLQYRQRVIDLLVGRRVPDDADDSAHSLKLPTAWISRRRQSACPFPRSSGSSRRARWRTAADSIAATIRPG